MPGVPAMELLRSHQTSYATESKDTPSPVRSRLRSMAALGCAMGLMLTLALSGLLGPSPTLWSLSRLSVRVTAPTVAYFKAPNARIVRGRGPGLSYRPLKSTAIAANKATRSNARSQANVDLGLIKDEDVEVTMNPLAKASWYAVETFGKIFATKKRDVVGTGEVDLTKPPTSAKETLSRIRLDNDRQYFLSGEVDKFIYDPDCIFSDPFVAFKGRDRFIENLQNLGSFITKYDAKPLNCKVENNGLVVETKVMVKLELNLPWKPILAWPWGVRYEIDSETFLVTDHKESWDIGALDGVKQIFRKPTLKI